MSGWPTICDGPWARFFLGSRPFNIFCFACEEVEQKQITPSLNNLRQIKDQIEELVEMNLAALSEESGPIFINPIFRVK